MKHKKLKLSALILLVLGLTGLQAQETNPTSGGNASGNGGSVAYSVGQVFCASNSGADGSVTEGVQQPYEITVAIETRQGKNINLICTAYPNPVKDHLTLDIKNYDNKDLSYQLYDMKGNILESNKIISDKSTINVGILMPATYFLRITRDQTELKVFKIVKN